MLSKYEQKDMNQDIVLLDDIPQEYLKINAMEIYKRRSMYGNTFCSWIGHINYLHKQSKATTGHAKALKNGKNAKVLASEPKPIEKNPFYKAVVALKRSGKTITFDAVESLVKSERDKNIIQNMAVLPICNPLGKGEKCKPPVRIKSIPGQSDYPKMQDPVVGDRILNNTSSCESLIMKRLDEAVHHDTNDTEIGRTYKKRHVDPNNHNNFKVVYPEQRSLPFQIIRREKTDVKANEQMKVPRVCKRKPMPERQPTHIMEARQPSTFVEPQSQGSNNFESSLVSKNINLDKNQENELCFNDLFWLKILSLEKHYESLRQEYALIQGNFSKQNNRLEPIAPNRMTDVIKDQISQTQLARNNLFQPESIQENDSQRISYQFQS